MATIPPTLAAARKTYSGRSAWKKPATACLVPQVQLVAGPQMRFWYPSRTQTPHQRRANHARDARQRRSSRPYPSARFSRSAVEEVRIHHHVDKPLKIDLRLPAQVRFRLGRVPQEEVHLRRAEVSRVDFDDDLAGPGIDSLLLHAFTLPLQRHVQPGEDLLRELPDRMSLAGRYDIVLRLRLLEHQPHGLHVVSGKPPVALGIKVAEEETFLEAELDPRRGPGDLPGDEGLAAPGRFVVEQYAVAGKQVVALPVVQGDVVGIGLGAGIGGTGIERGGLRLRGLDDLAVQLGGGCLVELRVQLRFADPFQYPHSAEGIDLAGVFRHVEGDPDMALRSEVVDLVRPHIPQQLVDGAGVVKVAVVKKHAVPPTRAGRGRCG